MKCEKEVKSYLSGTWRLDNSSKFLYEYKNGEK